MGKWPNKFGEEKDLSCGGDMANLRNFFQEDGRVVANPSYRRGVRYGDWLITARPTALFRECMDSMGRIYPLLSEQQLEVLAWVRWDRIRGETGEGGHRCLRGRVVRW